MTSTEILQIRDLAIGYGKNEVCASLDLTLQAGEVLRITGPNASGKSTLAQTLVGVLPPLRGGVFIGGHSLRHDPAAAKQLIGYSSGDLPYTTLTGRDHLEIAAALWGVPRPRVSELLGSFPDWPLVRHIDEEIRVYSQGTHQQLAILVALVSRPKLLVLDEAFDNIDDQTLGEIFTELRSQVDSGVALVYVSHRHDELWPSSPQRIYDIKTRESQSA